MHWGSFTFGVLAIPALCVAMTAVGIVRKSVRDTYRSFQGAELKEGYSRWNWFWCVPMCFAYQIRQQCWSWWNGIETEVN